MSHVPYSDKNWLSYNLHKEDLKKIQITWHTPCILLTFWHSACIFFHSKSANFDNVLKINVFWNEGYGIIILAHDHNKILSLDSNYIVDVIIWPKFCNSIISEGSYCNLNFSRISLKKTNFLRDAYYLSSIISDWQYVWLSYFTLVFQKD